MELFSLENLIGPTGGLLLFAYGMGCASGYGFTMRTALRAAQRHIEAQIATMHEREEELTSRLEKQEKEFEIRLQKREQEFQRLLDRANEEIAQWRQLYLDTISKDSK